MITLYHCFSARSFRPLWMLEEMGLRYELKMLPFPPRALAREYLQLNPLGTIPLLLDEDTRMTESSAICHYLGVRHGPTPLVVDPAEADYGAYLNSLHQGEATLTFPQTLVLRYGHFESPDKRLPQVAQDYGKWFLARLRWADAQLADKEWLAAGRFTAADISVGYALMLAEVIGLLAQAPEGVQRYWARLKEREGFARAMRSQEEAAKAQGVKAEAF